MENRHRTLDSDTWMDLYRIEGENVFGNEGLLYSCRLCLMFIVALATGFHECYCKSHARPTLSV